MEKTYNKLVRDNIPKIIKQQGNIPITKILNDEEHIKYLNKKLLEEVTEYLEDYSIDELCDVIDIIYEIIKANGFSSSEINKTRENKKLKNGAFDNKILLEKIIFNNNN